MSRDREMHRVAGGRRRARVGLLGRDGEHPRARSTRAEHEAHHRDLGELRRAVVHVPGLHGRQTVEQRPDPRDPRRRTDTDDERWSAPSGPRVISSSCAPEGTRSARERATSQRTSASAWTALDRGPVATTVSQGSHSPARSAAGPGRTSATRPARVGFPAAGARAGTPAPRSPTAERSSRASAPPSPVRPHD